MWYYAKVANSLTDLRMCHSRFTSKCTCSMWQTRTRFRWENFRLFEKLDHTFIGLFQAYNRTEIRVWIWLRTRLHIYTYRQYRKKAIAEISEDKTLIKFRQRQDYFFDKRASAPFTEDDNIVMLNIPLTVSQSKKTEFWWFDFRLSGVGGGPQKHKELIFYTTLN